MIDELPGFQAHSPTSLAAAISMLPHLARITREVLAFISSHPEGVTADAVRIGLRYPSHNTASPRIVELERKGLIVRKRDSFGEVVTAKTSSGRAAVVYVVR